MNERKETVQKLLSLLISLTLLLGFIGPAADTLAGLGTGDEVTVSSENSEDIKSMELQSETNSTKTIDSETNWTSDTTVDYNLIVTSDGHLRIINSTVTIYQDKEGHLWNITVKNGGQLTLINSTIKTSSSSLRPFLKTDINVYNSSKLSLRKGSALTFPGYVKINNSNLTMKNSRFDKLNESEISEYDYLWDGSDNDASADKDDNDDCPRLIVKNHSNVYMEEAEINNYYGYSAEDFPERNDNSPYGKNEKINSDEMTWYPLNPSTDEPIWNLQSNGTDDPYVLEENNVLHLEEWYLYNPVIPHKHLDEYPYINPIDKISSLYVEISYNTQENYTDEGSLTYYSPKQGEYVKALNLERSSTDNTKSKDIWEIDLRDFDKALRNGKTRLLQNLRLNVTNPSQTETDLTSIEIDDLRLISAYDNDIHIKDSDFTAINSYIDMDYRESDIDPRNNRTKVIKADEKTYLEDSNMKHSVLRLYNSSFKSYGLKIADDKKPSRGMQDADPWILNTKTSRDRTWIYRWVELQITNQDGIALPNAKVKPSPDYDRLPSALANKTDQINDLSNNSKAWEYLNETGMGHYDAQNDTFVANENGNITLFLSSDRINYPNDWPNSKFVGNYEFNITYQDSSQNIYESVTESMDSLPKFPNMDNPYQFNPNVDIDLPDLKASNMKFTVDGDETGYVANDTAGELELNVSNIGDREAYDVNVSFYRDQIDQQHYIYSKVIDRLNASKSKIINVSWGPTEIGNYTIKGVIDLDDNIVETEEQNNQDNFNLTVGEKPELFIEQIYSDKGFELMNTTQVNLTADITNSGGTDVSEVTVGFYHNDTSNQNKQLIGNIKVDVEGNGSTTTTPAVEWDTSDIEIGDYNITVVVDPNHEVDELNETNNTITRISSILTKPDLTPINLEVNPDLVRIGNTVNITVNVTNQGQWSSQEITVNFTVDGTQFASRTIPALDGNETSKEISVEWVADITGGQINQTRTITVEVEPDPNEGDTGNQTKSSDVTVERYLDLSVDNIDIAFSEVPEGKNVEVTGTIRNVGDLDVANLTVELYVDGILKLEKNRSDLTIGESMVVTFNWNSTLSSSNLNQEQRNLTFKLNNTAEVSAEGGTELEDEYPSNNTETAFITVYEAPDLTPVDFNVSPDPVRINETVDVSVKVQNQGEWTSEDVTVDFLVDGSVFATETLQPLEGGETSQEITIEWTADMTQAGKNETRTIKVKVSKDLNENNTSNQEVSQDILIERYLDLSVTDLSVESSEVPEGKNVLVSGDVSNTGDLDVANFTAQLLVDGEVAMEKTEFELDSGESMPITFDWESALSSENLTSENRELTLNIVDSAEIDNGKEVDDQTPADNSMEMSVSVYEAPDLTPIDLKVSPDPVRINKTVAVSVKVANRGNWPSEEVTLHFSVDDKAPFYNVTLSGLNGGSTSQEITAEWTADMTTAAKTQDRTINVSVEADSYEANFDNLTKTYNITVERRFKIDVKDIEVTPGEVTAGEEVNVQADILNVGDLMADQLVELYIDEQVKKSKVIDNFAVDEERTVTFTWKSDLSYEGIKHETRSVSVRARDDEALTTVTVNSKPDLNFVSKTWYREDKKVNMSKDIQLVEMDSLRFEGQIKNEGGTPIQGAVVEYIFPDGTKRSRMINASVGETVNVSAKWTVDYLNGGINIWVNSTQDPTVATTYDEIVIPNIQVNPLTPMIDKDIPKNLRPGETYVFSGTVTRESDGKPVSGKDVVVTIQGKNGKVLESSSAKTNDQGTFTATLRMPGEGGDYKVVYETKTAQPTEKSYSISVESETQGLMGIPWWIIVLIVAVPAAGISSYFIYREFFGVREMVECGNCGETISADVTTCPKCGVEFDTETVKCSECGEWIPADSDVCPECGAEFIKTGKEIEDYTERMRKQFRKFVNKQKRKAEEKLDRELSKKEFMDWWKDQPSFVTFEEWVKRKEIQRREGSKECPECGTLNSVDDAVCQKCGTSLIELGKEPEEEVSERDFEEELSDEVSEDLDHISEIEEEEGEEIEEEPEEEETETEEEEEPEEEEEEEKEGPKRKKKKVKKKVVKKPPEEEEE